MNDLAFAARVESTNAFITQEPFIVKDKAVGNPIFHVQHGCNGTDKYINSSANNGNVDAFIMESLDDFPSTFHQIDASVCTKDLILMDGISNCFPQLDVGAHELYVRDFATNEPVEVQSVIRSKGIVEGSPRTHSIYQHTVTVEDHNLWLASV
jgi:hypothetical protein